MKQQTNEKEGVAETSISTFSGVFYLPLEKYRVAPIVVPLYDIKNGKRYFRKRVGIGGSVTYPLVLGKRNEETILEATQQEYAELHERGAQYVIKR